MSLGYALLNRNRIELALGASPIKRNYDETIDITFGALGAGNPGPGFQDFLNTRAQSLHQWIESVAGDSAPPDSPFAALRSLFQGDAPDVAGVPDLLERLAELVENAGLFKETVVEWLSKLVDGLPDLSGEALLNLVRDQIRDLTGILEGPYREGRRDRDAHGSFRAAVTIRQLIGSKLDEVSADLFRFDLRALLRQLIQQFVGQLPQAEFSQLAAALRMFHERFGGLFRALAGLSASASVSVGGSGPQGMPDPTVTFSDEHRAAPHEVGHALWVLDLVTNIFASFNSIWEMVRTANWSRREFDGVLSVILILWQTTHTVMRSAFPGAVNLPKDESQIDLGRKVLNGFFTDQGNLYINFSFRLLASWVYETSAPSDWALSFAQRMLKYFTSIVNVRFYYWFFRSWWYFQDWKENGFVGEGENRRRAPVSLNRVLWAVWGPWFFLSSVGGLIPAWEDFTLENGLGETRTWVPLLVFGVVGGVVGYIALWQLSGHDPFALEITTDWNTFTLFALLTLVGVIALCIIVDNLESDSKGGAWAGVAALIVVLAASMLLLAIVFGAGLEGFWNSFALGWMIIACGLVPACVLPFIMWWYYIDDSRDKLGFFDGKDPETSPYLLPFPEGENWICGQGVHGIFSHFPPQAGGNDNHYAYDFNEAQDKFALAAREGIVVRFTETNPNDQATQNDVDIQHLSWVEGHDPGTDLERVLTRAAYIHLSQNRIWVDANHRFVQGYHIADIDNTGRSALNHLHYHVEENQRGGFVTVPVIFKDDSLRRFRNYPLLAWVPGKGHIPGKPISMAYYISDNAESDPVPNPVQIQTSSDGTPAHSHTIDIDRRVLTSATLPSSLTWVTSVANGHFHQITLSRADLLNVLGLRPLDGLSVSSVNGHSHTLLSHGRLPNNPAARSITLANPPAAQLVALRPGPYQLVGDQLVLRVNDRGTEYFFYGAIRPALRGDVALDRGLGAGLDLSIDGTTYPLPAGTTDQTARGTARSLTGIVQTGGSSLPLAILALPVIVLETRRRGRGASLEIGAGSSAPMPAPGQPRQSSGGGPLSDLGQIAPADLVSHFNSILQNGWPAAPAGLAVSVAGDRLLVNLSGAPVDFSPSSGRLAPVLTSLYDTSSGALRLRATGPIPFSTGRIDFGAAAGYTVPILATPAQVRIDTTNAVFSGAALTASPLEITVLGVTKSLNLQAGDADPARLARLIALAVEGVRAWPEGNEVVVETVSAGPVARVEVRKDTLVLNQTGASPALSGGGSPIQDACALAANDLNSVIQDAGNRATLGYDPAAAAPQARLDAGRLVVEVASGHTIEVAAVVVTGGADPFNFTRPADNRIQSDVLSSPVVLRGPAWIDLTIDAQPVRIPLDAEGARLDLGVLDRMPASGETLALVINGGAPVTVAFAGTEPNIAAVAEAIAAAAPDLSVRIAYTWSVENALYHAPGHTLQLDDASGLAAVGFLRDRGLLTATSRGVGADQVEVPAGLDDPVYRDFGEPVRPFTVAEQPSGSDIIWNLTAEAGLEITARTDPGTDPLGLPTASAATIATAPLADTFRLGGTSREYSFDIGATGAAPTATARMQLDGAPAVARTRLAPVLPFPGSASLNVTIIEPTAGGTSEHGFTVDLTGVGDLREVAQRLNAGIPLLRSWTVPRPSDSQLVLHVETLEGGNGWELRLDNPPLLVALGFDLADIDLTANRMSVAGHGNVRDARAVTRDELRSSFQRVLDCATGLVLAATPPTSLTPLRLRVAPDGANLALSSLEGAVTIETAPTDLRTLLNVTESPAQATLSPGSTAALDNGDIVVKVGGRTAGVVHLWGDHATVRADQPLPDPASADGTAMLALLKAHPIQVLVDGSTQLLNPVPAAVGSFEEAVESLAAQVADLWIGIVGGHVVLESRGRGSGRQVEINFSQFTSLTVYPAHTILGFASTQLANAAVRSGWRIDGDGRGSVRSLEAVSTLGATDSLEQLFRTAAATGAAPQAVLDVEVDTATTPPNLQLRGHRDTVLLEQPTPLPAVGPGAIPFNPPAGAGAPPSRILVASYPGLPVLEPDVFVLDAEVDGLVRRFSALFAGQPARLPSLEFPTDVTVLNNAGFTLTLADGISRPVQFTAPAGVTSNALAAQIERQCGWHVRARTQGNNLLIETVENGSNRTIALAAPSGSTSNAITGDPATGFTAPRALPIQEHGAGSVPNLAAVSAADFQHVLANGFLGEITAADSAVRTSPRLNWRAYEVMPTPVPGSLVLQSGRAGCISSLTSVVLDAPALNLSRSLERAPAMNGSVALPAFTGIKNLSGTLHIELNDNQGIVDLPATTVIPVAFPSGAYTAKDVAARIHRELFGRGAGQAGAYADGTVVIESLVPGLAGTVRVPAPGTATSGPDQTLLQELIGPTAELFGRGWPGVGFTPAGTALRPGFRSRTGTARAAAQWVFRAGSTATTPISISAGQSLADIQSAVDSALRTTTAGRIGICLLGPDETLHIEATGTALALEVDGAALPVTGPSRPGDTPDRQEEPALGLRRTEETRTFRFMRDRFGNAVEAEFDDVGWIRATANPADGTPSFGMVVPFGRYWLAVRPDAARTREYHSSGDMVLSGGVDPADNSRFLVHRARFWVNLANGQFLRIANTTGGEFLADVLLG